MNPYPSSSNTHVRFGVMGAGLIGCYLGGLIASSGRAVTLIGRGRIQGDIAENGLNLTHFAQASRQPDRFVYATDPSALSSCDVVLVCVKSHQTKDVARELANHIRSDALVISFQNAIGNDAILSDILPGCDVISGMVPFNVTSPQPGNFHKGTEGPLFMRAISDQRLIEMKTAFEEAGQAVELREPMEGVLWGKLLLNLNNPLNTLHGGSLRSGLLQSGYRKVLACCMREGLAALDAAGISPVSATSMAPRKIPGILSLPTPVYRILMDRLLRIDRTARSSMLDDLTLGRQSENAHIQGEIIRLGQRFGVDVSTNRRVSMAVEQAFEAGMSPRLTGREMAKRFL